MNTLFASCTRLQTAYPRTFEYGCGYGHSDGDGWGAGPVALEVFRMHSAAGIGHQHRVYTLEGFVMTALDCKVSTTDHWLILSQQLTTHCQDVV